MPAMTKEAVTTVNKNTFIFEYEGRKILPCKLYGASIPREISSR